MAATQIRYVDMAKPVEENLIVSTDETTFEPLPNDAVALADDKIWRVIYRRLDYFEDGVVLTAFCKPFVVDG